MSLPRSFENRNKNAGHATYVKIVDDLNRNGNLHENCLLVSFDVVNMFPSTDNNMGIESVKNMLLK